MKEIPGFDKMPEEAYDVAVKDLVRDQDYKYEVENFPEEKKSIYTFSVPDNVDFDDKKLDFILKDSLNLSENKTRLQD